MTVQILLIGCEKDFSGIKQYIHSNSPVISFSDSVRGSVHLKNQYEHGNALIYLDEANVGTRTESSGLFTLKIPDTIKNNSGVFTIYYFLEDYDLDSSKIELKDGKLLRGVWDVDTTGMIPPKEMNQILNVDGWTDKQDYRIGDTLHLRLTIDNLSVDTLYLVIYSAYNDFGTVSLWRDKTYPHYFLSPYDPVGSDRGIYLFEGGFYEGTVSYIIPQGVWIGDSLWPLLPNTYMVVAGFEFEDRGYPIPPQIREYIEFEWRTDLEAISGFYMYYTSKKYKYPKVQIIK